MATWRRQARDARRSGRLAVDDLVETLRIGLAQGQYAPRERLVEADLVERYGAPRAAVREALIQLASEGLVERAPNRGARVRGMTLDEAIEIAEVRRALEAVLAARAAERATAQDRAALAGLASQLGEAAESGDVARYLGLNARFHAGIHEMAGHTTGTAILAQFRRRPIDRFFPEPFRAVPPTASVEAHTRIAAAIAAGDPIAAERAMHAHLTDLMDLLRRFALTSADPTPHRHGHINRQQGR